MSSAKKTTKPKAPAIAIADLLKAMDRKDRDFYDNLGPELQKKFSGYMGLRWGSSVRGNSDLENYYLASTNINANYKFFSIPKEHAKLQWLVLTTISPGMGTQYHEWIPKPSMVKEENKAKFAALSRIYPAAKLADIEVLANTITEAEFQKLVDDHHIDE
jgi:hypothetical protein